jgi:hypothetical protein
MHTCPACGHQGHDDPEGDSVHLAADGAGADERAIKELARQERSAPPGLAKILKGLREQIRLERKGAQRVASSLGRIYRDLAAWLKDYLARTAGDSVAERAARAGISLDVISAALEELGLGDLRGEVFSIQADAAVNAVKVAEASGVAPGTDVAAITALAQAANARTMLRFWQRDVIESANDLITNGLLGSLSGETLDEATDRIAKQLEISAGKAKTQARTAMAGFSRAVSATQAAAVGATHFYYGGPQDPLTRRFCEVLVRKVITREQLSRLNNGQNLPVANYAGGNNCRHSVAAISEVLAQGLGLDFATDEDIETANRVARR